MAVCFPDHASDIVDPAASNLWHLMHKLPDAWKAWIRLGRQTPVLEFLLLHDETRPIWLLHVDEPERVEAAVAKLRELQTSEPGCPVALMSRSSAIGQGGLFTQIPQDVPFIGSNRLKPERLHESLLALLGPAMTAEDVQQLRRQIAPEVVVPVQNTARRPAGPARPTADVAAFALDYRQEDLLKRDLILSAEGQEAAESLRARVVTGVAGSGKSLVLIHRARLLAELNPGCTCLGLTHNNALSDDLSRRYGNIRTRNRSTIWWRTFLRWCRWLLFEFGVTIPKNGIISDYARNKLIKAVHQAHFDNGISWTMFRDEIDWIKDCRVNRREDYLQADRQGRGFGLTEQQREKLYEALRDYQQQLRAKRLYDWGDLPLLILRELEQGKRLPQYDAVLIDEAQFFPPVAFEIIRQALRPGGHIFFSADPTQGFLKRRLSWLSMGIDIRGRSHRLTTCYRTTRAILTFARDFYHKRLGEDEPDLELPDEEALAQMDPGKPPLIVPADARQDERAYIVQEIGKIIREGTQPQDILVLHADGGRVGELARALAQLPNVEVANLQAREMFSGSELRVCALDAATGLECPIVFVVGAGTLLEREDDPTLAPEDREQLIRDNTRRLYMAFTRASTRLVVTMPKQYAKLMGQAGDLQGTGTQPISDEWRQI